MTPAASNDPDQVAQNPETPATKAPVQPEKKKNTTFVSGETESDGPQPIRHTLPKAARMPAGGPYELVFRQRKAVSDSTITLNAGPNGLAWHRLGLGVAKKMFRKAVARNRVKRLIREAFRLERPHFGGGLDLVVRPKASELTLENLRRSLRTLVPKAERKFGLDSNARGIGREPERPPDLENSAGGDVP